MTRKQAVVWCQSKLGQAMDFDGQYGAQCVDFFNYYIQEITGKNPYSIGFGVSSAYQLFSVAPDEYFDKSTKGIPQPGDIMIYRSDLPGSGGNGHVSVVLSATNTHITVYEQNWGGMYVKKNERARAYELGYLSFKEFDVYKNKNAKEWYLETVRLRRQLTKVRIQRSKFAAMISKIKSVIGG